MKIRASRLYAHAANLQRLPVCEEQSQASASHLGHASIHNEECIGWMLRCPHGFEATWNGGPNPEDISIQIEGSSPTSPSFVQSYMGNGLLTLHTGYQFKTEAGHELWIRGPVNGPKDGLRIIERIVDTSLLPAVISIQWRFTIPQQSIRIEKDEPFCIVIPYPQNYFEQYTVEVVDVSDDADLHNRVFQQWIQAPAVQQRVSRLQTRGSIGSGGSTAPKPDSVTISWSKSIQDPPPVSCICPTYGRVDLLEEAIQSFLMQDYPGAKELIVLNDYHGQTFSFDHPEVRIVNRTKRFHTIGEKFNVAAALCSHDIIFVWHDDDIYLPHRISYCIANFDRTEAFFKVDQAWVWNHGRLQGPERNLFHGGSCWRRSDTSDLGVYARLNQKYDLDLEQRYDEKNSGRIQRTIVSPSDIYYIYRWGGTSSYHLSVTNPAQNGVQEIVDFVDAQAAAGQIRQGLITLNPRWQIDYTQLVQTMLDNNETHQIDDESLFFSTVEPTSFLRPGTIVDDWNASSYELLPDNISVIVTTAEGKAPLERMLDQLVATLPAASEIIVVDNGPGDRGLDFLDATNSNAIIRAHTPSQLGLAAARNLGLSYAHGEIVIFINGLVYLSDCWWQPLAAALEQPAIGVVGPGFDVLGKARLPTACGQRITTADLHTEWMFTKDDRARPVPLLGNQLLAMRPDTLSDMGQFDEALVSEGTETLDFCIRCWLMGREVWVVPEAKASLYFSKTTNSQVGDSSFTADSLRVAITYFNPERIVDVIAAAKQRDHFDAAMAHVVNSNIGQRREGFAAGQVWNDEWFFKKFENDCVL